MASGKSNYLRSAILNGVLGGPGFTLPGTVYVALSAALWTPSATGSALSEVSAGGYGRIAATNNTANFPASSGGGAKSNGTALTYSAASADWGSILSAYLVDAASGGNCLYGGDLAVARAIVTGDTPSFAIGALVFQEQ